MRFFVLIVSLISCGPQPHQLQQSGTSAAFQLSGQEVYQIGAAKRDITGPVADLGTMGYATPTPKTGGIQQRLWARAFVVKSANDVLTMVVLDIAMVSAGVKALVLRRLNEMGGGFFDASNVLLTATHTHSGPGGYSNNWFYNIPTFGVSSPNIDIIANGVAEAIMDAHSRAVPGTIRVAKGRLENTNRNRSILAYMENPESERNSYPDAVDKEMVQLRFDAHDGRAIGILNWFALHQTSVNKFNRLVSGDNKGYAAAAFEREIGGDFVAAFANKASGDVTPNIDGDVDGDGDWECRTNENFSCARESGERQYRRALQLYETGGDLLSGPVQHRHTFGQMSDLRLGEGETCGPAIGVAMLSGSAEDGPGILPEGIACSNEGGSELLGFLRQLRCRQYRCHGEKVVALAADSFDPPMILSRLPIQIFTIGPLAIVAAPGEWTTMAGRRLTNTVSSALQSAGITEVLLTGYSNDYAGYTSTREEYQLQHYEGGHTVFGEMQLDAYRYHFRRVAEHLAQGTPGDPGSEPELLIENFREARSRSGRDRAGLGRAFGQTRTRADSHYERGDTVQVSFVGANPNNDLKTGGSYIEVQRQTPGGWTVVADDTDWDTRFIWESAGLGRSNVTVEWNTRLSNETGAHRIVYRGHSSNGRDLSPFVGTSNTFVVE